MKDFDDAIDRIIAGLEKKRAMSGKERRIVAYHEAGHAIVGERPAARLDPVHKISIVAAGFGALGYTMQLPLEDRYLMSARPICQSQLAVLLGGRRRRRSRSPRCRPARPTTCSAQPTSRARWSP